MHNAECRALCHWSTAPARPCPIVRCCAEAGPPPVSTLDNNSSKQAMDGWDPPGQITRRSIPNAQGISHIEKGRVLPLSDAEPHAQPRYPRASTSPPSFPGLSRIAPSRHLKLALHTTNVPFPSTCPEARLSHLGKRAPATETPPETTRQPWTALKTNSEVSGHHLNRWSASLLDISIEVWLLMVYKVYIDRYRTCRRGRQRPTRHANSLFRVSIFSSSYLWHIFLSCSYPKRLSPANLPTKLLQILLPIDK
ncbi:uncharacterized protein B0I36DRAFT_129096 [Microdochium trichocladiopsis]|uniref:Uncharacterized protein n=1 Tax=Microdochium trichocladiopsis TaxID=1682393 RepID=A0A9P8Y6X4_9PEZI|nr:uncharacterized protein B0I36DRAFT_129096 [Microdochium trichocladiopsis]KAH7029182.1 hypothetical protein B0I36DRAFT_129096 [Microdochium trichocladiopsis]